MQVRRPDAVVRARSGFLETGLIANPELTHKADVELALSAPFDATSVPITVRWTGKTQEGEKQQKIGYSLEMPESSLVNEDDKNRFDMDLMVQFSAGGTASMAASKTLKGNIPAQALPQIKSESMIYNHFIVLPRGKYEVRFLVRDNLSGKIGTVSAPLLVD